MPFSSLSFGQFCDFSPKVCFSASGSKRFKILPFSSSSLTLIHFSPLSQGYFCLFFCKLKGQFGLFHFMYKDQIPLKKTKLPFKLTKKTKMPLT
ncbi:hypothetical protein Hanom_Chr10g00924771 [Helianthus anomalus]